MQNLIDFSDKKVLIAGASSGIGKQIAISLSKLGAAVILIARRENKLQEVISQLEGKGHSYYVADLSQTGEIEGLVKKIVADNGKLDGMVYSAGIAATLPVNMLKPEKLLSLFQINYFGFVEMVRQVSKKGRYNDNMRIVGISSVASIRGDKSKTAYSSSKSAMDSAVRCMAKELAEKGICINTVAPAMTETELFDHFLEKYGDDSESSTTLLKRQYLGIIQPEDVANAVAFLLSPAARFITGITLPVDGGLTTT